MGRNVAVAVVVTSLFGLGALLALSPASPPGVQGLLFGDVLGASDSDLVVSGGLALGIVASLWLFHGRLLAVGFDRAFARSLGISTAAADVAVLTLLAAAILVGVQGMGNLLVVAVLVGPAATARQLSSRMKPMMLLSVAVAVLAGAAGLCLSYYAGTAAGASVAAALRRRLSDGGVQPASGLPSDGRGIAVMPGATIDALGPNRDTAWVEHALVALESAGYHRGGARLAVIELLARQDCAVTAIEIDDRLRATDQAIGRASVYRTLEQLEELKLVQRLEWVGAWRATSGSSRTASITTMSSATGAAEWSPSRTPDSSGRSGGWRTRSASRSPSTRSCSAAAARAAPDRVRGAQTERSSPPSSGITAPVR